MKDWYKEAVVYQIYPKSFCDTNGDGIGDIKGIISKLDYLEELGVNTVWLSPCYPSPGDDNGYDISDYCNIDPIYGTMDDFKEMLEGMHKRGIRLLMDLVVNHTSDEHKWFEESRKGKDNPYRDYYIWKDPVDGAEPNDWKSNFGGSAWEFDESSGQYYLHLYSKKQPDLNWENERVQREIIDMINFWLDLGVDGFRCDVINSISKDFDAEIPGDGPRLHEYINLLNRECFAPHNAMTVGEVWGLTPDESLMLTAPEREELSIAFQFDHMSVGRNGGRFLLCDFEPEKFIDHLARWQYGLENKGWNAICIENHDQPRALNRYADYKNYRYEAATMLATILLCLKGTPFIFQGQEIGLINPTFNSLDECRDIESINSYPDLLNKFGEKEAMRLISADARDCGRAPIPWDDGVYGGFSTSEPWLKLHDDYRKINVESDMNANNSVFGYYKKLIALHKNNPSILSGDFKLEYNRGPVSVFSRNGEQGIIRIISNFSDKEVNYSFDYNEILLSNFTIDGKIDVLPPYASAIATE